jgi:Phospholipase_D-nuclease N-terminal
MVLAADYPLLDLFWTFLLFFGLIVEFWLLITVFADLFRRHDVSGWGKAAWTLFVFVVPLVGALVYLISQGRNMAERGARDADLAKEQTDSYIRSVAAPGYKGVDEIARGKELLDHGTISQEEFDELKARALV